MCYEHCDPSKNIKVVSFSNPNQTQRHPRGRYFVEPLFKHVQTMCDFLCICPIPIYQIMPQNLFLKTPQHSPKIRIIKQL